jgi:hypothetical protein
MPLHDQQHMLTPHDAILYGLYADAVEGFDGKNTLADPLAPSPTPHLDNVYDTVLGAPDIAIAFATQYRSELGGRLDRPLPLVSIVGKAALVGAFIREGYPPSMQHFADPVAIVKNLSNPTASMFSFVVLGQEPGKRPDYQAVCTAYVTDSKVAPGSRNVLYIDDLVIGSAGQSKQLGILAFREVLTRAAALEQDTIEMRARRRTSHKGFRGPIMARILSGMGYASTDHGVVAQYGTGEDTEYSHLIEVTKLP